jgi:CheY-like chemotaxis protein
MNKKILIIEDVADVRLGYHVRPKANNYDTFFAADGPASTTEARKHHPELTIAGVGSPGGDGFVVMERLKTYPHLAVISIIVVSARDPHANRERSPQAGAKAFLRKPVDSDERLAVVRQCLGETKESKLPKTAPRV